MAILFSYPTVTPKLQDLLIGTEMAIQGGQDAPRTRTFTVGSLISLVQTGIAPTLQQVTTAGGTTTNTININKADNLQALVITGDAATNGLIQVTANDGPCIRASASDGDSIISTNIDGTGIRANCTNEGAAIAVNGGDFGSGLSVLNGGVNIVGLVNPITTYQLSLSLNSAVKPSTNTWTVTSDARVKTNINPYTKGLETILAINPVTYDYNGKAGFDPTIIGNIGIIAQDVLNIIPESINTYQSKLNEDDEEKTELYNFDSHALTFILINAIKELSAEIQSLKAKVL